MNGKRMKLMAIMALLVCVGVAQARIKLVALPERAATVIRLDNPLCRKGSTRWTFHGRVLVSMPTRFG
ncbi:MAG: hypothetical protein ACYSWZ_22925 [Planctomycetota bacterium]|jgi:hypothetical protein